MSKATLSLLAACLALAATSAWLARELAVERAKHRPVAVTESTPAQRPRATPAMPTARPWPPEIAGTPADIDPNAAPADFARQLPPEVDTSTPGFAALQRVQSSADRAYAKRTYADFVAEEGLSPDEANRLFETLADDDYTNLLMSLSGEHWGGLSADWQSATEARLAKELGDERMSRLLAFAEATAGRNTLAQLAEQLEGRDLPLNDEQRRRLIRAVIREREHFKNPGSSAFSLNPAPWTELSERQLAALDHLQAICQPVLSPEQMQAVTDLRDALNESQRYVAN